MLGAADYKLSVSFEKRKIGHIRSYVLREGMLLRPPEYNGNRDKRYETSISGTAGMQTERACRRFAFGFYE